MTRRVLALGTRNVIASSYDSVSTRARSGIKTLQPTVVYTDLSPGWNLIVGKEAVNLNYSVTGVFPYGEVIGTSEYKSQRALVYNRMYTKLVFESTYIDHLKDSSNYRKWLVKNVDHVLAYLNPDASSYTHQLMVFLRDAGIPVLNLLEVS